MTIMKSIVCGDSRTYNNFVPIYVKNILVNMKNIAISLDYPGIQFRLPCTPPQDNFSWVPNYSLGPPGWETKVSSKKFWFGLCEIAWFLWQPIANLRRGVCLQNYSYLSCYLS